MGLAMIGGARIARETGSFAVPITCMVAFFVFAVVLGLFAASGRKALEPAAVPRPAE